MTETVRRIGTVLAASAALAMSVTAAIAGPAAASAPKYWVSAAATVPNGHNCANPDFNSIQGAFDYAESHSGGTVVVCPGGYHEQLQLAGTKNVAIVASNPGLPTVIEFPTTIADATTACDTGSSPSDQVLVDLCGTHTITVTLSGLTLNATWPTGQCGNDYGVLVGGGDVLKLDYSKIVAAGPDGLDSCDGGVGLEVGMSWTTPVEVGHASVFHDQISGYQWRGAVVDGGNSSATFTDDLVFGAGPTTQVIQRGIQISNGAYGRVTHSTVLDNECAASDCGDNPFADHQAIGVVFQGAAKGSSLVDPKIKGNDLGVLYASGASSLPSHPDVTLVDGSIGGNRYENVAVDQGRLTISAVTITGGRVGVLALQYDGQQFGPHLVATNDRLFGSSYAAIQVVSDQAMSGDLPGSLVFTSCRIHGATRSNSSSVTITT